MKRLALALTAALGAVGALRLRCYLRGQHAPVRHFLGGFRCMECGKADADLEAMGFGKGSGYVGPMRRTFERKHGGEVTRGGWVQ